MIGGLTDRAQAGFRHLIEMYVETGQPVGSKLLTERSGLNLSAASIRSVMAELETKGLLYSPHTSAGRVPTEAGLRLFVDALMEVGDLSQQERAMLEAQCLAAGRNLDGVLAEASVALSGLTGAAGLVIAPKQDRPLRQIDFVDLDGRRLLIVLVGEDGQVENRIIELPQAVPVSSIVAAANYLNRRILGRNLEDVRAEIQAERQAHKDQLDVLSQSIVDAGLAFWTEGGPGDGTLIVRGQGKLLDDVRRMEDLARLRTLFDTLEAKDTMLQLLEASQQGDGVRIFIGAENTLFRDAGVSTVLAPFRDSQNRVVGALGVIGPTRLPYGRIVPMVDYTADLVGRLLR